MTGVTQQPPGYESVGAVRLPPGNLEPVEEGDSEVEDYGSFASESVLGDVLSNIEEEDEEDSDDEEGKSYPDKDPVFEKIKESLSRTQRSESAQSGLSSMSDGSDGPHVQISSQYTSIPYGIQVRATYEHSSQHADIMGVAYNGRMRQFVILDSKGITTWKRDLVDPRVRRALQYPKYEYRLIMNIVYAPKYNCYFALGKDFSVKVLNRDFEETCSVNTDMRSVLYILFNPVRDELITGGVGGIKIWQFQQVAGKAFTELKPLANYELRIKDTLPNVGGSWVKRVDLDYYLQHLYCCSDTDLHVYDLSGKLLFKFERAHTMSITGCCFSPSSKVLITSSVDSDVKIWSLTGGLVHTFRGHSRAVTGLLLHPETSSVIITASLDGSVRMWSLDTMDLLYMIVVSADGVMWMGLTDDKLLYLSTCRNITLWHLNKFYSFWGLARNQVSHLSLASCEEKTTRVLAVGDDSSVRMFTRSNHKNITTVLPPPDISPLQKVLSVCYSREKNTAFLLITNREIWVYTTRTDPSCRTAIWDVHDLQMPYISGDTTDLPPGVIIQPPSQSMSTHRATENGHGNEIISNCCSLCILNSTAMMWTDEGLCCPIRHTYLLLGMEDGRILFMDPVIKGQKYMELKASKDAIQDMKHDIDHGCLITLCRLKTLLQIQVWGLPQLDAMYELYCGPDITCYARLGLSLMTGHTSGQVNLNILNPMEDTGINKSTQEPPYESIVEEGRRPEHHSGLVAMDSLASMSIYVTCSSDGAIKVWDESKVLLTEVMLEESLSAACFLNDMGDLLIGFKNHIFYIDHNKLCPAFKPPEIEMETSDQESDVYEDPRVLYELIREDEEPVTLKNYLVPYDHLEFDEDFLEGKTKIEQPKTAAEALEESESETETDVSLAPSSIYLSPAESIESLSMIDLTLGADYSKYDLNAQMKTTMDQMVSKGKKHRKHVTIETPGYSDMEEKDLDLELEKFMLPAFGESPGGSPSITPPSGEATPKRAKHRLEDEDSEDSETREEEIYKEATGFVPIEPAKGKSPTSKGEKAGPVDEEEEEEGEKKDKGKVVDMRGIMKKKRRVTSGRAPSLTRRASADHSHDDHDHDHDHGHDDKRSKKDIKKKQQLEDRARVQRMDMSKLASLPPNPPSMLTRKRSLSEARKNFELNLVHQSELHRDSISTEHSGVHGQEEEDIDHIQEEQWAMEAAIHGKTLTIPPQRDKHHARVVNHPDPRLQRMRDRKHMLGEREPVEVNIPGIGSSPTAELEKVHGQHEESDQREKNVPNSGTDEKRTAEIEQEPDQTEEEKDRGTPDSGIEDIISVPSIQARVVAIKEPEILEGQPDDPESLGMGGELLSDTDKANAIRRPASSFTGLRRGQQEGERLRAERPHTAHVRFKAEDLQCAFEEAFKRYQNLPGTPGAISADTLYKNDGTNFEENWQTRIIERHTLLRLQKEIRAQSAAQRRQAIEVIKQDKQNSKLFPSRCGSAIGGASNTDSGYQSLQRANTSMSVPINYSYGVGSAPITQSKARPETANPALEKQQMIKSELSHEKAFRFRLNKGGPAPSRPASSRSISTVADFSPHWIDPRNPDAWRPKSSRSIPSKCNRYILVNKPREKPGAPVPSPLEEQLLVERFPKKGSKVAPTISEASTPRVKKSYSLEYSPFVYQRYV